MILYGNQDVSIARNAFPTKKVTYVNFLVATVDG